MTEERNQVDSRIMQIAQGPSHMVKCYKGYFTNGFNFQIQLGQGKDRMNSGVCVKGSCYNDHERDYYGMLVLILELEYFGIENKVVLFKCDWYDIEKELRVHPHHGLVELKYKSRLSTNEPFVLAQQAQQVYYMSYPSRNR